MSFPCPCHSHLTYQACCQPFHHNEKLPQTPLQLMRSRYAAYALNLPDYIIQTTHPQSPHFQSDIELWKKEISEFSTQCDFVGLTILSEENGLPFSYVTFTAHIERKGSDCSFTEKSLFVFEKDRWVFK